MNLEVLANQLLAMRATIDAALMLVMQQIDSTQPGTTQSPAQPGVTTCLHRNRKNLTVMGGKEEWLCLEPGCGHHFKAE